MTFSGAAVISLLDPLNQTPVDSWVGLGLLLIALTIGLVLTIFFTYKLVRYPAQFTADLFNPGQGAQTAAWPASLLIAALATSQAGVSGILPALTALIVGIIVGSLGLIGTVITGFSFFNHVITHPNIPAQAISAGWFVPVVPLVLVPSITFRLSALSGSVAPEWAIWLAVSAWGIGFGLFMLLASIVGGRLLMHEPPQAHALPTWWAWLAPLGAGGLGLVASSRLVGDETITSAAYFVAAAIWGFAAWWSIFAIVIIFQMRKEAHFHLGYWGFGFPTASMAALSLEIGRHFNFGWLVFVGDAYWILLMAMLVVFSVLTVSLWRTGKLFPAK